MTDPNISCWDRSDWISLLNKAIPFTWCKRKPIKPNQDNQSDRSNQRALVSFDPMVDLSRRELELTPEISFTRITNSSSGACLQWFLECILPNATHPPHRIQRQAQANPTTPKRQQEMHEIASQSWNARLRKIIARNPKFHKTKMRIWDFRINESSKIEKKGNKQEYLNWRRDRMWLSLSELQ